MSKSAMIKNLMQLYNMVICCVSTMVLSVVLACTMSSITDLTLTEYKHKADLERRLRGVKKSIKKEQEPLNQDDINKRIEAEKDIYIREIKDSAIKSLIDHASWIIISTAFFVIHFIMYKRNVNKET